MRVYEKLVLPSEALSLILLLRFSMSFLHAVRRKYAPMSASSQPFMHSMDPSGFTLVPWYFGSVMSKALSPSGVSFCHVRHSTSDLFSISAEISMFS